MGQETGGIELWLANLELIGFQKKVSMPADISAVNFVNR